MFELHNAKTISLIRDLANDSVQLRNSNGVPQLHIKTALFTADVSVQGAQLLKFCPSDGTDWLYAAKEQAINLGQPIDAGIPLCLPWFGRHQNPAYPIHGYLREELWQLSEITLHDDHCELLFHYQHTPTAFFDYRFSAEHRIHLGRDIQLALSITNHSSKAMPLSFAWHSYFHVEDSFNAQLIGLDQHVFLDNLAGLQARQQQGVLQFGPAVDAVFEHTTAAQTLFNGRHFLQISGHNCPTAIVWNPGPATRDFVCAERGRAFADSITLATDQQFCAHLLIKE